MREISGGFRFCVGKVGDNVAREGGGVEDDVAKYEKKREIKGNKRKVLGQKFWFSIGLSIQNLNSNIFKKFKPSHDG